MGRKLTYFERAQREREKERDRVRRANAVASRRAEARRKREHEEEIKAAAKARERNAAKREKEREAIREKILKEEALEAKINNAKKQVEAYNNFIENITKLHLSKNITGYKKFNDDFQEKSKFDISVIKRPIEPNKISDYKFKAKEFSFDVKKFQYENEKQIKKVKEFINYSAEEYSLKMNKYKPNVFGWILYFIILFPFAILHFIGARKNFYKESDYLDFIVFNQLELTKLEEDKNTKQSQFLIDQEEKRKSMLKKFELAESERKIKEKEDYDNSIKTFNILLEKYRIDLEKYNHELEEKKILHNEHEETKINWYNKLISGDKKTIEEMIELLFPIVFELDEEFLDTDPSDIEVGFNVINENSVDLCISIDKELKYIPEIGYKLTATGKDVSEYNLTQKVSNEYINSCICSLTLAYVKAIFEYCRSIENLRIELSVPSNNKKTGEYEDEILVYLNANRSVYNKIVYSKVDPIEAISNFEHEYKPVENRKISIESKLDNDNIVWTTKDDTGVVINPVIKRAFKKLNYI